MQPSFRPPPSKFLDSSIGGPGPGAAPSTGGGAGFPPQQRGAPGGPGPQYGGGLGGMSDPFAAANKTLGITKNPGSGGTGGPSPEDWLLMLKQFADEMGKPLDMEDPLVSNILQSARTQTLTSANGAGVYGGYSQNQAERSYIGAAAGLQQQRRQMGQQAIQSGVGASQDLAKLRYGQARDSYQDMLNNYKYEGEQREGFGAGLGGALGGAAGGIGGFFLGGPAGAAAGFSAGSNFGSSIGRGVGGMGQPPPPTFTYRGYGSGRV